MNQIMSSSSKSKFRRYSSFAFIGMLALYGSCSKSCGSSGGSKEASANLEIVPSDTNLVVEVSPKQAVESPIGKKVLGLVNDNPKAKAKMDQAIKDCGFDPMQKIESLFIATNLEKADESMVMIVRGSFDDKTAIACLKVANGKDMEFTSSDWNKYKIYEGSDKKVAFVFPTGKDLAIAAKRNRLEQVLNIIDKKTGSAKENAALMEVIKRTPNADAAIWVAGLVTADKIPQSYLMGLKTQGVDVSSMKDVAFSLSVKNGLHYHVSATLGDKEKAKAVTDKLTASINEAKNAPQVKMMLDDEYFKNITAFTKDSVAVLEVKLSQDQVDKLFEKVKAMIQPMLGAGMGVPL